MFDVAGRAQAFNVEGHAAYVSGIKRKRGKF